MAKCFCLMFAILLVFLAGCETYKYSLEMKPCDDGVERKLVWSGDMSDDVRNRISKSYKKRVGSNTFYGKFSGRLPNDVGGAGFYNSFVTNMGKMTIYSERFRGKDDLNEKDTLKNDEKETPGEEIEKADREEKKVENDD